eukprot:1615488-Prymnesium_polylepis.2
MHPATPVKQAPPPISASAPGSGLFQAHTRHTSDPCPCPCPGPCPAAGRRRSYSVAAPLINLQPRAHGALSAR